MRENFWTREREEETQLIKRRGRARNLQLHNCAKRPEGGKQKGRGEIGTKDKASLGFDHPWHSLTLHAGLDQ
jgi:hypothetical protein